jgi:hypothetical protein
VNDLGGTLMEENIWMAGSHHGVRLGLSSDRCVRRAGRNRPNGRLYEIVETY